MKRLCISAVLLLAGMSTGCCYYPGYINPYDGMAYGGRWEPCCGLFDPLGLCYGPGGYGGCQCGCAQAACCQPACGPDCCIDGQVSGGFADPTFAGESVNAPCINQPPVSGSLQPMPDPKIEEKRKSSGGSATYVYPPHQQPAIQEASQRPWVEAY